MEIVTISLLGLVAVEASYLTYVSFIKNHRQQQAPVFIDTSVLIDGRIIAVAEAGFIGRPLIIPRSVVGELQFLADNGDSDKRTRARHGLDIISQLQAIPLANVSIMSDSTRAEDGVDNRLLELAKKYSGAICTIDYNLNKVAVVENIEVLNVNELAKSLRMSYLPGEKIMLELTQKGNESHQAVGHLPDGTMVVVEHAYKQVGSSAEIEFIRSLQTAAGKMMFAKLAHPQTANESKKQSGDNRKPQGRKAEPVQPPAIEPPKVYHAVPRPKGQSPSQPQQSGQPRSNNQRRPSNNRRRSPEDSMVELANK